MQIGDTDGDLEGVGLRFMHVTCTVHVCMLIIYFYLGDDLDLNLIKAKATLIFSIWRIRIFNWNIILSKFLFSRGGLNESSEGWATLNLHPTRNMGWLAWIRI